MPVPHLESIGFSTADADTSAAFFTEALGFRQLEAPLVVEGGPYASLIGLPGSRLKLLRLAIGSEVLELSEVLDPSPGARPGRAVPADSRSNDRWFQHICLVVKDMEAALVPLRPLLQGGRITPISTAPTSSTTPKATRWSCCSSRPTRGRPAGTLKRRDQFRQPVRCWASTTAPSASPTPPPAAASTANSWA